MTMQIVLDVPNQLGEQLQKFPGRLVEVLEIGLRELQIEQPTNFKDEEEILDLLASQPTPEQIISLKPSAHLQSRMSELLAKNKEGALSSQDEKELDRYFLLEHLVRLAKTHAYRKINPPI